MRKVEVVSPNPQWRDAFTIASQSVAKVLGDNVVAIHHIGSTAIPNIYAKPIIDILVAVENILEVDRQNSAMEAIGYEVKGELGIRDRRFFLKNNSHGIRTHHIHTFKFDSPQIERHLAFRDYAIAHPQAAQKYSDLKQELAKMYPYDMDAYIDGKDAFIKAIDEKAAIWRSHQTS